MSVEPTPTPAAVRIITTGGTFDKRYNKLTGEFSFGESHVPDMLRDGQVTLPFVLASADELIDSLAMTDEHRQRILEACAAAPESQIVIVHGTDTMTATAAVLGRGGLAKCIVLTGAMVPYNIAGSDAEFNLGFALAAVQLLPQGVYIAMNGHCFDWDGAVKNRSVGLFEALPAADSTHSGA